jgi:glutamine cyclotransferase
VRLTNLLKKEPRKKSSAALTSGSNNFALKSQDTFYLITYNKLITVKRNSNSFEILTKKRFLKFNQRESIAITPSGSIFIANEGHWLLGKQRLIMYKNE